MKGHPFAIVLYSFVICATNTYGQERKVTLTVDLSVEQGELRPIWSWFGYDEPNYTYMEDGKKLLSELAALSSVPVYVRTHNLLTSGDGKADFVTFRDGAWKMLMADGSTNTVSFGQTGDLPIAGDFDNDGKSDIGTALKRPVTVAEQNSNR